MIFPLAVSLVTPTRQAKPQEWSRAIHSPWGNASGPPFAPSGLGGLLNKPFSKPGSQGSSCSYHLVRWEGETCSPDVTAPRLQNARSRRRTRPPAPVPFYSVGYGFVLGFSPSVLVPPPVAGGFAGVLGLLQPMPTDRSIAPRTSAATSLFIVNHPFEKQSECGFPEYHILRACHTDRLFSAPRYRRYPERIVVTSRTDGTVSDAKNLLITASCRPYPCRPYPWACRPACFPWEVRAALTPAAWSVTKMFPAAWWVTMFPATWEPSCLAGTQKVSSPAWSDYCIRWPRTRRPSTVPEAFSRVHHPFQESRETGGLNRSAHRQRLDNYDARRIDLFPVIPVVERRCCTLALLSRPAES